tara:strand:+ start:350 stop:664 length:315 start_codon:yes stop_codon:yes gene_type:complete
LKIPFHISHLLFGSTSQSGLIEVENKLDPFSLLYSITYVYQIDVQEKAKTKVPRSIKLSFVYVENRFFLTNNRYIAAAPIKLKIAIREVILIKMQMVTKSEKRI